MCVVHSQVTEGQGTVREGKCLGQGQHLEIVVVRTEVLIRKASWRRPLSGVSFEAMLRKDYVILPKVTQLESGGARIPTISASFQGLYSQPRRLMLSEYGVW